MQKKLSINKGDLDELAFKIVIRNDTSGMNFVTQEISIIKIHERGVTVSIPEQICMQGHRVTICLLKLPLEKEISLFSHISRFSDRLELVGKTVRVEKSDDSNLFFVKIHFTQFEKDSWDEVLEKFMSKQESIKQLRHKI